MSQTFSYGDHLTYLTARQITKGDVKGILDENTKNRINQATIYVQNIIDSSIPVYGINTGFGPLCNTRINKEDTKKLQENLLKSHAVGVGKPIDNFLAKLMLILKVQGLSKGNSGVQLSTIERIIWMIDENIIPVVPEQGSVGASGDLAPLSHLFLPLIGEGKVNYKGQIMPSAEVLNLYNLPKISLSAKEGLGLINGTQFISAHAVMALHKMSNLLDAADICGALMIEGLKGSVSPFHPQLHATRPFPAIQYTASKIWHLLENSDIVDSHKNCDKVQDPYSLRCIPQVHGASRAAWLHVKELTEIEINAVTDNPILIDQNTCISGGNFHGQPLAMALDYLTIAVAEIGNISDRRSYLALEGKTDGVPKLLMTDLGTNSGFMLPQYTSAALVSENKSIAHPASLDSIPTSLGQEDHVSMGSISGRKLNQVIQNVEKILGIELMTACQALDFHLPLQPPFLLQSVHALVRRHIPHLGHDELFYPHIDKSIDLIATGMISNIVRESKEYSVMDIHHRNLYESL